MKKVVIIGSGLSGLSCAHYLDKNKYDVINGISIAPKKEFNIIKIWFKTDIKNINKSIRLYDHYINVENCRLKKHF